jgi:REP element-mobilizing transposase RayT
MQPHVYNLRSRRCFSALAQSFAAASNQFGFRLVHYSVQGNHIHFLVEAEDKRALSRGMQGLTIRMARALNRVMNNRKGKVFSDRYQCDQVKGGAIQRLKRLRDNNQNHEAEETLARETCEWCLLTKPSNKGGERSDGPQVSNAV